MNLFDQVAEGAPDPIFGLVGTFLADKRAEKINLMVGTYHDEQLRKELMPVVRKAKEAIASKDLLADYLPIDGLKSLPELLGGVLFGEKGWKESREWIYGAQGVGGTGALRAGAEFLAQHLSKVVAVPDPTWANHKAIFERAGFVVKSIPYYNRSEHRFDRGQYIEGLKKLEKKTVVLLHACCHNPTGSDPTEADWREISTVCKERELIPFFDMAYQGFGKGVEEDAYAVRLFLERGHEMLVAYSCSKNFSLYCQRVGALFAVCKNEAVKERVGSQIRRAIRAMVSNPPAHGAKIVEEVLTHHKAEWVQELNQMRKRIESSRHALAQKLSKHFQFILSHQGMFSYLDLTKTQVQTLIDKDAIYTLDSGRINVAGLTSGNIARVTDCITEVCAF
jgi:aromatic-amino-acid transaminase